MTPGDDLLDPLDRTLARRADCCSAPAGYRVVFRRCGGPSGASRPPAELQLCGHHYRASTVALLEVQASVYDARGRLLTSGG